MEKLLIGLLEAAKKDKQKFISLKSLAAKFQLFELSANLRDIEKQLFPESEEETKAKKISVETSIALRMVGIDANSYNCYLIRESLRILSKKKGKFSTDDASKIISDARKYFIE